MKKVIFTLVLIGAVVYTFNLTNALFWDDTEWIAGNPYVHSISWNNAGAWFGENVLAGVGLNSNYYRPVLMASFAINYVFHHEAPIGYHLVNNGLHIANGILIFLLLLLLTRKKFIAFFVALFFLIHPLQTEAITYISGRGDPLHVFFMLLALILFVQAEIRALSWRNWRRPVTLALLVLALLSRETAIIFPFLLVVVAIAFLHKPIKRIFLLSLPYFAIVTAYGILRLTVLNFDNTLNFYGSSNPYTESIIVRLYTFLGVLGEYARLLIFPINQHMERSVDVLTSIMFWEAWVPLIALIGLLILLLYWYRTKRTTYFPILFFAMAWFFVCLAPTSGVTPINALLYEHWLYLAMIGPLVFIFYVFSRLWERYGTQTNRRIVMILPIVAIAAWFSWLGIQRNILWGKPLEFFEDILRYEPQSARILTNVANIHYHSGDTDSAVEYYWRAVNTNTIFPQPYYNLGRILFQRDDTRGAIVLFEKAIVADEQFPYSYQELAVIYAQRGEYERAKQYLQKLLQILPTEPRAYLNLAKIEFILKHPQEALILLRDGLVYADRDLEAKAEMEGLIKKFIGVGS